MNFQSVRYFLALCEERNFTRAAQRCGIAQPTLTLAIKRLEARLGGSLFHRPPNSSSRSQPTNLALVIKPHLKRACSSWEQALRAARTHRTVQIGERRGSIKSPTG